MHELTALSRLALLQHRWVLIVLLVAAACGPVIAAALFVARGTPLEDSLVAFAALALMPGMLAGAILFGFTHGNDLLGVESGCIHWLLRAPVQSWKIAIVPVVLKTLWISAFWGLFALAISPSSDHPQVQVSMRNAAAMTASAVGLLLALKLAAVACAAVILIRTKLATLAAIAGFVGIWAAVMLTTATVLGLLIPHPQATLLWCIALTALAMPLARLLIMPRALHWNRHR